MAGMHTICLSKISLYMQKMEIKRARARSPYTQSVILPCDAARAWDAKSKSALKLHTVGGGAPVPKSCAQFHSQFLRSFSARETPARPTSSVSALEKRLLCPKRWYRPVCMWSHAGDADGIYVEPQKHNKLFQNKGPDAQNYGAFFFGAGKRLYSVCWKWF